MCGIICGISTGPVAPSLVEGLRRLEYRGYDSAGVAVIDPENRLKRLRSVGKVEALAQLLSAYPLEGSVGIAHTRWATHGQPKTENAHPHVSNDAVAVVHNGIVENHDQLRGFLEDKGYVFESETDTEVIAHLVEYYQREDGDLRRAVSQAMSRLEGAFTFGVICSREPRRLVAARKGSPLVAGFGEGQYFVASDLFALLPFARRFIFLEEGDIAEIDPNGFHIFSADGSRIERPANEVHDQIGLADKGGYRHYMLKEIHEQPAVVARTLQDWLTEGMLNSDTLPAELGETLKHIRFVHLVACGTSYHAGLTARYWFENFGIPCAVEVASEYRYRSAVVPPGTLLVTVSQSGETADTLAALREAKIRGYMATLAICNVPNSSIVRESDHALITRAGPEIGVASTKAFTTQLISLQSLGLTLAGRFGLDAARRDQWVAEMRCLPQIMERTLEYGPRIEEFASRLAAKNHALFLGRGMQYPIAMEGALKLKEISYIHAEAYPAGELKHGPLALVDNDMEVVCTLSNDGLQGKTLSNLQEVQARGGNILLFADERVALPTNHRMTSLSIGAVPASIAPIVFTLPLQLLAYYTAVLKGADVDQPRNLAKSVTVE